MNLFKSPKQAQTPAIPEIDEARQRIDAQRSGRLLRTRAASMLAPATQAPTAQQTVTGN